MFSFSFLIAEYVRLKMLVINIITAPYNKSFELSLCNRVQRKKKMQELKDRGEVKKVFFGFPLTENVNIWSVFVSCIMCASRHLGHVLYWRPTAPAGKGQADNLYWTLGRKKRGAAMYVCFAHKVFLLFETVGPFMPHIRLSFFSLSLDFPKVSVLTRSTVQPPLRRVHFFFCREKKHVGSKRKLIWWPAGEKEGEIKSAER